MDKVTVCSLNGSTQWNDEFWHYISIANRYIVHSEFSRVRSEILLMCSCPQSGDLPKRFIRFHFLEWLNSKFPVVMHLLSFHCFIELFKEYKSDSLYTLSKKFVQTILTINLVFIIFFFLIYRFGKLSFRNGLFNA